MAKDSTSAAWQHLATCALAALLMWAPSPSSASSSRSSQESYPGQYADSVNLTTSEGASSAQLASKYDKAGNFKKAGFFWSSSAYSYKRAVVWNTLLGDKKATARSYANKVKSSQQGCKSSCEAQAKAVAKRKPSSAKGGSGASSKTGKRSTSKDYAKKAKVATSMAEKAEAAAHKLSSRRKFEAAAKDWSTAAYYYGEAVKLNTLAKEAKSKVRSVTAKRYAVRQACRSRCVEIGKKEAAADVDLIPGKN